MVLLVLYLSLQEVNMKKHKKTWLDIFVVNKNGATNSDAPFNQIKNYYFGSTTPLITCITPLLPFKSATTT